MGEKMTTALASACATATVNAVKTVRRINARKAMRVLFATTVAMITVCAFSIVAFAAPAAGGGSSGAGDGTAVANEMITKIKEWVVIISGVVIVFGAVNAGLGVANQDDAGRNRGFMTMAGGAIMAAVVGVVNAGS